MAQRDSSVAKVKFSRFLFSVSVERSSPFGEFATYKKFEEGERINYTLAGPPTKGMAYKLDLTYFFIKSLGITGAICRTLNETPPLTVNQVFPSTTGGGLGGGSSINSFSYWAGNWQTNNFLLGLVLETGVERFKIRLKLSGGFQKVKSPPVVIYGDAMSWTMNGPITYYSYSNTQESSLGRAFVLNPCVEFYLRIKGPYGIMLSGELLNSHSDFRFNTAYTTSGGQNNSSTSENKVTKHVTLFNFGGGICYSF